MNLFGSLKVLFDGARQESNVILIALPDEQVKTVYKVIDYVCGNLKDPDSGVAFTINIEDAVGFKF
jgi:hypothetical protein